MDDKIVKRRRRWWVPLPSGFRSRALQPSDLKSGDIHVDLELAFGGLESPGEPPHSRPVPRDCHEM